LQTAGLLPTLVAGCLPSGRMLGRERRGVGIFWPTPFTHRARSTRRLCRLPSTASHMSCTLSSFAASATASSYFHAHDASDHGWHPSNMIGPPAHNGECSSGRGAWSPATGGSGVEWVRATFSPPVFAQKVEVWESFAAPFIRSVAFEDEHGQLHSQGSVSDATPCGGTFVMTLDEPTTYRVAAIHLSTAADGYEMVDAIRLTGVGACLSSSQPSPPPTGAPLWAASELSAAQQATLLAVLPAAICGVLLLWYMLVACRLMDPLWPCSELCAWLGAARRSRGRRIKMPGSVSGGAQTADPDLTPRGLRHALAGVWCCGCMGGESSDAAETTARVSARDVMRAVRVRRKVGIAGAETLEASSAREAAAIPALAATASPPPSAERASSSSSPSPSAALPLPAPTASVGAARPPSPSPPPPPPPPPYPQLSAFTALGHVRLAPMGGRSLAEDLKSDTERMMRGTLGCGCSMPAAHGAGRKVDVPTSDTHAFGLPAGVITSTLP
jgi:hypothetical protein